MRGEEQWEGWAYQVQYKEYRGSEAGEGGCVGGAPRSPGRRDGLHLSVLAVRQGGGGCQALHLLVTCRVPELAFVGLVSVRRSQQP